MVQYEMAVMAIGAYRGGEQTLLPQSHPVDAGRVIDGDIPFFDLRHPRGLPLYAVAFAAKARDVRPVNGGIHLPLRQYKMPAMTVRTVGDIGFFVKICLSMCAVIVVFRRLGVATGAVDPT